MHTLCDLRQLTEVEDTVSDTEVGFPYVKLIKPVTLPLLVVSPHWQQHLWKEADALRATAISGF